MAKKAAGAVFGAIDLTRLGFIINIIADGNVNTAQIRNLLKSHISEGYTITSDDVRNIRSRCFKYSIEETPIDSEATEKIVTFKPLDEDESITLPDTDTCRKLLSLCDRSFRTPETAGRL
jgi:hypothetical protein